MFGYFNRIYKPKKAIGQDLQDLQDYRKSATGEYIAVGTAMCSVHPVHPVHPV
jgi:hypothetical protein